MQRRLPSLTSLRAFEAAGRHLSFTKAAVEMTVTQAAISHQVKSLEKHLNVELFHRLPRKLELTLAGKSLLPVLHDAFDMISQSVGQILAEAPKAELTVRLAPTFAAKWLIPRLEEFRQLYPHIELSLTHSNAPVDFGKREIDIAVTYGKGNWPGVVCEPLLALDYFPVCAPEFLESEHPLLKPEDLRHYTLLHDTSHANWTAWMALAGLTDMEAKRGTVVDDTNVLIEAAIDGLGVALGSSSFIADHLLSGRLVRPFGPVLRDEFAYFVVCPEAYIKRDEVGLFRDWIIARSQSSR